MSDGAPLLKVLRGETLNRPPVWFMRQAGRYLPEYRDLRSRARDFIQFCLDPEMAAEATLQPLRRFRFDAAIIFADILLIPMALGQEVAFLAGEGPRLGPLPSVTSMAERARDAGERLSSVGRSLARVAEALSPETTLIGFAGAPWTVATYMLDGEGAQDRAAARRFAWSDPEGVDDLLSVLVEATVDYLAMQARAGAGTLKLFESWAEGLPEPLFERLVVAPHRAVVKGLRDRGVDQPIIGFPRGAGALAERYAEAVEVDAVALDTAQSVEVGRRIQTRKPIQGALDPLVLRAGGEALDAEVRRLRRAWGGGPWIFNLGHGILPDTPIAHVEQALARLEEAL